MMIFHYKWWANDFNMFSSQIRNVDPLWGVSSNPHPLSGRGWKDSTIVSWPCLWWDSGICRFCWLLVSESFDYRVIFQSTHGMHTYIIDTVSICVISLRYPPGSWPEIGCGPFWLQKLTLQLPIFWVLWECANPRILAFDLEIPWKSWLFGAVLESFLKAITFV